MKINLLKALNATTVKGWQSEYRFHKVRRWRFDYAHPLTMIAIEVEGGAFTLGRHTRGAGFIKDMEKYNSAVIHGWRVLRYTPGQMQRGEFIEDVKSLLKGLS